MVRLVAVNWRLWLHKGRTGYRITVTALPPPPSPIAVIGLLACSFAAHAATRNTNKHRNPPTKFPLIAANCQIQIQTRPGLALGDKKLEMSSWLLPIEKKRKW